jgi:crotonobetainyl-CoA:carnitine CoA-transferase CaiB-like acyl-CoA transferase
MRRWASSSSASSRFQERAERGRRSDSVEERLRLRVGRRQHATLHAVDKFLAAGIAYGPANKVADAMIDQGVV